MRIAIFVIGILLAAALPAQAEKLTLNRCLEINGALASLDSYEKDGKKSFYKLSIETRKAIANNLTMLRDIKTAFEAQNNALLMEASDGSGRFETRINPKTQDIELTPEGQAQSAKYAIVLRKVLETEQDVKFAKIKMGDLLKDENPIPPTALSALAPLLED